MVKIFFKFCGLLRKHNLYLTFKSIFRASVQATIIHELESHHPEHDLKPNESKTADLEIAVLVQELMAMREDKADLRAQGGHHVF